MKRYFTILLLAFFIPLRLGAIRTGGVCVACLKGANMNSTSDQLIPMDCNRYIIRRITAMNASTSLTLAVGGIYTATSKGGSAVVAATQVWSTLTGSTKFLDMTLASITTTDWRTEPALYLSLTTSQGGSATVDLYIYADCVD